jgi:hypothetical protein
MKMERIECSETSAYKIQTPGNHPEENIQHTEHGKSLKSKISIALWNHYNQEYTYHLLALKYLSIESYELSSRNLFKVFLKTCI